MQLNAIVRPMTVLDLQVARGLSTHLQWPHRSEDWAMMFRVGKGFVLEQDGQVIGTTFTCNQGAYSTIGLVIVDATYQGQGLGRRLMEQSLAASDGRQVMLNATAEGAPLYRRMGFETFGSVCQYQRRLDHVSPAPALTASDLIRPAGAGDLTALMAMANDATGMDRASVLNDILPAADEVLLLTCGGQPSGFAVCRPFGFGHAIGPVVAPSEELAWALIQELLQRRQGDFVRLDCPAGGELAQRLEAAGFERRSTVERMVLGEPPSTLGRAQQFVLINQALC